MHAYILIYMIVGMLHVFILVRMIILYIHMLISKPHYMIVCIVITE